MEAQCNLRHQSSPKKYISQNLSFIFLSVCVFDFLVDKRQQCPANNVAVTTLHIITAAALFVGYNSIHSVATSTTLVSKRRKRLWNQPWIIFKTGSNPVPDETPQHLFRCCREMEFRCYNSIMDCFSKIQEQFITQYAGKTQRGDFLTMAFSGNAASGSLLLNHPT